jgi:soluble lytic murein transglycosylase-like protein
MEWVAALFLPTVFVLGSLDPYGLHKEPKINHATTIIKYAEQNDHDPYELLAIAITESDLNPRAVSYKGAVGLFQVMCKYWYKKTGYKSIEECNEKLFVPLNSVKAGVYVLTTYRSKYPQCQGDLAYRCYFAGHGWRKYKPGGKTANHIIRYEKKVRQRKLMLHKYYKDFIEDIRFKVQKRS